MQRLDGFPEIKVVFDKHQDKNKVAILSGGGAGHEPAHVGYVGSGMLAAAVSGEVFASPSAEAVLAGLRTVSGPAGSLVVLMNYTGDRLHFGLAVEQAKAEGLKAELVVVGEDVAIEKPGMAGRRGLAGTVLVHKAAGAAAAAGASLDEVVAVAKKVAAASGTLGVALRVCTIPGKTPSDRLDGDEMEIGLGIHGEPGAHKVTSMTADKLVHHMITTITTSQHFGPIAKGERLVLLVNNLGSCTPLEMNVMTRAALENLSRQYQAVVERVYVGAFMTSLDMQGVSLTLLRVDQAGGDTLLQQLDSPVAAPGWTAGPGCINLDADKPVPVPARGEGHSAEAKRPATLTPEGAKLEQVIHAAASALVESVNDVDAIDSKVGDGDCGTTLGHGASGILADLKTEYDLNTPHVLALQVARSVRHSVGGTSGALYDVFITAAARTLKEHSPDRSTLTWAKAFKAGTDAIQKYGGATPGCRTMVDALVPAAEACLQAAEKGANGPEAAAKAVEAAEAGAEATKSMTASAGRASYVPAEVLASIPDPGAVGATIWLKAAAKAIAAS